MIARQSQAMLRRVQRVLQRQQRRASSGNAQQPLNPSATSPNVSSNAAPVKKQSGFARAVEEMKKRPFV